jgi:hypothetical protein
MSTAKLLLTIPRGGPHRRYPSHCTTLPHATLPPQQCFHYNV